ncbi:ataxin-7 isoform X1 [Solea senegalensis]|uniref:Ataxin-7 isoform X1 n=1 Tax=Solea senegalensis TaxID=28829 RepID=A0AAV6QKZ0_SOLSE|nr:ataxin-7 isoform X1 [Solea senegalensis]
MRGLSLSRGFLVLLLLWSLSVIADAAGVERGGTGRSQRRGGGGEKRKRYHRIQHGQCSYTFILPELDGCQDGTSNSELYGGSQSRASVVQRDSPPIDGEWSAQKLQHLESTMQNNTQWLQKREDNGVSSTRVSVSVLLFTSVYFVRLLLKLQIYSEVIVMKSQIRPESLESVRHFAQSQPVKCVMHVEKTETLVFGTFMGRFDEHDVLRLQSTPYSQSYEGKSMLSYGTTLNARSSPQGGVEHPAYGTTQARQVSSLPQMPSAHSSSASSSSASSLASGRALKSRSSSSSSTTKSSSSFRPKEISSGSSMAVIPNTIGGSSSGANTNSSSTGFSSGKKRKNSSVLSSSHGSTESSSNTNYSSSFKKNCANVSSSGSTYHHSSLGSSSSLSSSHSGVHSVGLNCGPSVRTNSLSLKAESSGGSAGGSSGPPARGPPSGSPAESIKRMSVVMNSSDSTLSLGPFVHHQSSTDHHTSFSHHASDGRLEGKKRKSSPVSSSTNSGGGGGGGGGGPGRAKVAKSPAINNIHGKHGRSIPGTPGLPNNSHLHQPKARP